MEKVDAIIIGFGKGGKTLAVDLAKRNWKVAMIERSDKMYGGTCINIGCIPTKTLVHQANETRCLTHGDKAAEKRHYTQAIDRKNVLTAMLRNKNYHNLADNPNITVHDGEASFISGNAVSVKLANGDSLELTSEHIFINTGARSIIPAIDGVTDSKRVYTSTTIMQQEELAETAGRYRRRLHRSGIRFHVCRIRLASHRAGQPCRLHPERRPRRGCNRSRPYWKRKVSNSA